MKILWPDTHATLTKSMGIALDQLGYKLQVPSSEYQITHKPPPNVSQFVWNTSWTQEKVNSDFKTKNVTVVNKEQILDSPPDVIFVTSFENQFEILEELWPTLSQKGVKLVFYSGNDYWPDAYPWYMLSNYLCADQLALNLCQQHNKHFLYYCPWIDYEMFSYEGPSDGNKFGSYIADYEKCFSEEYGYVKMLQEKFDFMDLEIHSQSTKEETSRCMKESIATLHVKHLEGYGFAIIESMARGRPVFLHKKFAQGKSYLNWAIENATSLYFGDNKELKSKMKSIIECQEYRYWLQEHCSKAIRSLINNTEQTNNLKTFLNNLI